MLFGLTSLLMVAVMAVAVVVVAAIVVFWSRIRGVPNRLCSSMAEEEENLRRLRRLERDRIAGELHDTLLQGIHGLIWKFQALAERLPPSDPVRARMNEALHGADQVLVEGRDRVMDLRASDDEAAPLLRQLKRAVEEITLDPAVHFIATSWGDEFELTPRLHPEVIAIAAEALRLIYRHSGARSIELQLSFSVAALRVRIAHDGANPPYESSETGGDPEQWGLARMHERALAISADLRIAHRTAKDTTIDLSVPGSVAFGRPRRRRKLAADPANRGGTGASGDS